MFQIFQLLNLNMSHKPNKTWAIQGPFVPQVGEGLKDGAFALAKAHYVDPSMGLVVTCDHLKLMVRSCEYQTKKEV